MSVSMVDHDDGTIVIANFMFKSLFMLIGTSSIIGLSLLSLIMIKEGVSVLEKNNKYSQKFVFIPK